MDFLQKRLSLKLVWIAVGLMVVAIVTVHWKVGFFIFLPYGGWEYCATIAAIAAAIGIIGPGRISVDHALGLHFDGWTGALVTLAVGVGSAGLQLGSSYRPMKS